MNTNLINMINLSRNLYAKMFEELQHKYAVTKTEIDILLFLYNHPQFNTAADIIDKRKLVKSHVSTSLGDLEKYGYISRAFLDGNKKVIRIKIEKKAEQLISEGIQKQKEFFNIILDGFTDLEIARMEVNFDLILNNITEALKSGEL